MYKHLESESFVDLDVDRIQLPYSLNRVHAGHGIYLTRRKTYLRNLRSFNGLARAVKHPIRRDLLFAAHD